jgi:hypothetical protein
MNYRAETSPVKMDFLPTTTSSEPALWEGAVADQDWLERRRWDAGGSFRRAGRRLRVGAWRRSGGLGAGAASAWQRAQARGSDLCSRAAGRAG